jgi:transketolase
MRTAFIKTLCEIAAEDERIWLLCGDLGYSVLEEFANRFPSRFVNVGIAEQNMIGISAGLAMCGKVVFVYSIANFPTLRCLEQIRNDICYHNLNVNIVAIGAGFTYGAHGYTHHALEDLAIMRALPNLQVIAPGDPVETQLITRHLINDPSPAYLRLGKAGEPVVHIHPPDLQAGRVIRLKPGTDVLMISTGGMLVNTIAAAKEAADHDISVAVWSCPFIKPIDCEAILQASQDFSLIMTIEEGTICGGLGSAVAEIITESTNNQKSRLVRVATPDRIVSAAFNQTQLREKFQLDSHGLCQTILNHWAN